MAERRSGLTVMAAIAWAAAIISVAIDPTSAQVPTGSGTAPALRTPWGEPDLQGIWTDESDTPFQRPAKYASQEFFTAE